MKGREDRDIREEQEQEKKKMKRRSESTAGKRKERASERDGVTGNSLTVGPFMLVNGSTTVFGPM